MSPLEPLRCGQCGGVPPLCEGAELSCPYCGAAVEVPADYQKAAKLRASERTARQEAEPRWRRVSKGVGPAVWGSALASVALLPPAAALAMNLFGAPDSQTDVMAFVVLPLLLPGAAVFVWASAVNETTLGVRAALGAKVAKEEGAPPGCRSCGAPLEVEPDALSATCLYCGTDSLLESVPLGALAEQLRQTLSTLRDATQALRRRRRLLTFGALLGTLGIGATSALLAYAVRATVA